MEICCLIPPAPTNPSMVAERMLHSYWYNASEVKELMAWGSQPVEALAAAGASASTGCVGAASSVSL